MDRVFKALETNLDLLKLKSIEYYLSVRTFLLTWGCWMFPLKKVTSLEPACARNRLHLWTFLTYYRSFIVFLVIKLQREGQPRKGLSWLLRIVAKLDTLLEALWVGRGASSKTFQVTFRSPARNSKHIIENAHFGDLWSFIHSYSFSSGMLQDNLLSLRIFDLEAKPLILAYAEETPHSKNCLKNILKFEIGQVPDPETEVQLVWFVLPEGRKTITLPWQTVASLLPKEIVSFALCKKALEKG